MNSKAGEFRQLTISARLLTFFSIVILLRQELLTQNILFVGEEPVKIRRRRRCEIGFVRFTQIHNATLNLNGHKSGRWIYCKENWVNMSMVVQTIGYHFTEWSSYLNVVIFHVSSRNAVNSTSKFPHHKWLVWLFVHILRFTVSNVSQLKIFGITHAVWRS